MMFVSYLGKSVEIEGVSLDSVGHLNLIAFPMEVTEQSKGEIVAKISLGKIAHEGILVGTLPIHADSVGLKFKVDGIKLLIKSHKFEYAIAENSITLVNLNENVKGVTEEVLRLGRAILVAKAQAAGNAKVQMAVIFDKKHKTGLCFYGPPKSGKTSFVLALLRSGKDRFQLIANDKALISSDGKSAIGIPYAIGVRSEAYRHHSDILASSEFRLIGEKSYFWPQDLANHFGSTVTSACKNLLPVAVKFAPKQLVKVTSLTALEAAPYQRSVMEFTDRINPVWILEAMGISKSGADTSFQSIFRSFIEAHPDDFPILVGDAELYPNELIHSIDEVFKHA